jgi:hypothetical protein
MKIIFIVSLLISIYLAGNGYDCTGRSNVLGLEDSSTFNIIGANDCKDRKLCFLSCKDIYKNEKCSTKKIGFEVGSYTKAYDSACRRGGSSDPMLTYVKSLKFNGKLLFRSNEKMLSKGLKVLKDYLRNIREFDWCKNDGLYEKRQNQLLKEYESSKKAQARETKITDKNLETL